MPSSGGPFPRAFISYAHDTPHHREQARALWHFLAGCGVDAWIDFAVAELRQEWARTVEAKIEKSDFVLVVASPGYRRSAAAVRPPGQLKGRGVEYEAAILRELIYSDRTKWFPRVLPVVLPGGSAADLPDFLLPSSSTVYRVTAFTVDGAERLLRVLTGQLSEQRPVVTAAPLLPARPAPRGERDQLTDELISHLRVLPIMDDPEARAHFLAMVAERLPEPVTVAPDQDVEAFLRQALAKLDRIPAGLPALADTVGSLHRDQPIGLMIRRLIEALILFR